jgi:hypothetical protein
MGALKVDGVDLVDGVELFERCDASGGSRSDDDVSLSSPDGLVRRIGEQEKNRKVNR